MNAKQYEALQPYIVNLNQAKSNFVRMSRTETNKVREIYNEVFNKDIKVSQMGCTHCVLTMLKELAAAVEKYEIWKSKFGKNKENNDNNLNSTEQENAQA